MFVKKHTLCVNSKTFENNSEQYVTGKMLSVSHTFCELQTYTGVTIENTSTTISTLFFNRLSFADLSFTDSVTSREGTSNNVLFCGILKSVGK